MILCKVRSNKHEDQWRKLFHGPREELGYKIAHHDIESLKEAIKEGYDLNYRDGKGDTYLHIAVMNYDLAITKLLVETGVEINCRNKYENTPLISAVSRKDPRMYEIAKYLITQGADLDLKAGKYTARELIHMFEKEELMEFIKEK